MNSDAFGRARKLYDVGCWRFIAVVNLYFDAMRLPGVPAGGYPAARASPIHANEAGATRGAGSPASARTSS